ncbi:MAG: hypothetical protein A2648_00885 [Candidatus Lloydbacteria bacterium RIFCSPHIGHO2_01_FULL_41_20]|uniref:UDP-glucuronate decarboxylase n=1 Tax=Candidatus Lloydbacteria bacterium RIFCSPHIGHO2_01_FULL_41_20 TaxID=1798657 RepID=A0A1G2CVW9_9BACT|nr:MAG: hypothetical protein A2648_00885 [Candidatus Lloydbacteria bacterium RIFCSPHIGHO2_01_FULL_41_20]
MDKTSNGMKQKTILVTGGAGFIGSYLCEKYLKEGDRVIALDNLQTTITPKNIEHLFSFSNFKFIKQDIIEPIKIGEKIDWVFNFACSGSYTSYQYDPVHTVKTNTQGVINILELAKRNNARVMQASTSEIYGDPLEVPQKETYSGNVNMLGPRACYDEGKRCAETIFMDYHREYGLDTKIIRIFNTYGPNMDINDGRAITNFIVNALSGRDLVIYGDGSHTRSFQYIDDLVAGIDAMMKKDKFIGPVNLGNPGEITMLDLAELILKKTKSKSKIIFKENATDDPKRRLPDIALANKELNWVPKISLDKGLDKTIKYFEKLEQPDKKIIVFSTTYYPDLGPAERAVYELSKEMPETEFHIITTKFRPGLLPVEKHGTDTIYRVGFGHRADKYLLPILGTIKSHNLHKKHNYRFAWSVMASYGGVAALTLKFLNPKINFLLSIDPNELKTQGFFRLKLFLILQKIILKGSDSIFVSDYALEKKAKIINPELNISVMGEDSRSFMNHVRYKFVDLINKQEKKLNRPK